MNKAVIKILQGSVV